MNRGVVIMSTLCLFTLLIFVSRPQLLFQTSKDNPRFPLKPFITQSVSSTPSASLSPKINKTLTRNNWNVKDDGAFLTAGTDIYKVVFAYGGRKQGWFQGAPTSECGRTDTQTGGGGCDGSIVELYYNATDPDRNLVFRNGTWGSGYDALDVWEAEDSATDRAGFNNPDYSSNRHGMVTAHSQTEEKGILTVRFTISFKAWEIQKQYLLAPDGHITLRTKLRVVTEGSYNYLGHRFNLAGSRFRSGNNQWGGNWEADGEYYRSFTDGVNRYSGKQGGNPWQYDELIRKDADKNTVAHELGRQDTYTGFLIDGTNTNDPDIVVFNGAKTDWESAFSEIPRAVSRDTRSTSLDYRSYVETALFSHDWAPENETQVGTTWFYMTTPGVSADGNIWDKRGYWSTNLGVWEEVFHIFLLPVTTTASDYHALRKQYTAQ